MSEPVQMLMATAAREDTTTSTTFIELIPAPGHVFNTTQTAVVAALFVAESRVSATGHRLEVRIKVDGLVADPGAAVMTTSARYETRTHFGVKGAIPAGRHTVTVEWRVSAGTGYVRNRSLTVWEVR